MDTSDPSQLAHSPKRRYRSAQERRAIVEETLSPGASVSRAARSHDVNANQLFYWRKLYREGRLGAGQTLLPVEISAQQAASTSSLSPSGTIEIKLAKGLIRVSGEVDPTVLRMALGICCHDQPADRNADLDRCRSDGPAAWVHGVEWHGADGAAGKSVFWSHLFVSWASRRLDQDALVRWRWAMSFRPANRAWKIHLAAGDKRHGFVDSSRACDVTRRDRLATHSANGATDRCVSRRISRYFFRFVRAFLFERKKTLAYCTRWLHTPHFPIWTRSLSPH